MTRIAVIVTLLLVAAGCGEDGGVGDTGPGAPGSGATGSSSPQGTGVASGGQDPSAPSTPSTVDPGPEASAIADLADRLGVDPSRIEVVSKEAVTWPDTGLGCPQPGMAYSQVLTPGTRLVLSVDGTAHEYHAGPTGELFPCPDPEEPAPSSPSGGP